jgi:hypothetical protein
VAYGVMINLGDEDWLWVTGGHVEGVLLNSVKHFQSHQEAVDYAKQVWSVAWQNNRAKVEQVEEGC